MRVSGTSVRNVLVQLYTGMLGGIRRAQAHGNRWGARWTGGAGMHAMGCVCVCVRSSCALQPACRESHKAGFFTFLMNYSMCRTLRLIRKLVCLFLPLNTVGGLQVLLSL